MPPFTIYTAYSASTRLRAPNAAFNFGSKPTYLNINATCAASPARYIVKFLAGGNIVITCPDAARACAVIRSGNSNLCSVEKVAPIGKSYNFKR
ncbi:hypothetical protein EVAR_103430_1 [Eumeta japonica]|uniref:Uncharacterized protein n=1 Tax=Eumeta variegata TaxID=151549 RepID=A0A4C1ZA73_EUMVA|nr:hypothetical protein EVAR_103430_1 [Eumeta japonica]